MKLSPFYDKSMAAVFNTAVFSDKNHNLQSSKRIQFLTCYRMRQNCKKRHGKKEPPLWTVVQGLLLGGRSPAELLGAGKQGSEAGLRSKGSLRGGKEPVESVRAGKGFIARAGPPI